MIIHVTLYIHSSEIKGFMFDEMFQRNALEFAIIQIQMDFCLFFMLLYPFLYRMPWRFDIVDQALHHWKNKVCSKKLKKTRFS